MAFITLKIARVNIKIESDIIGVIQRFKETYYNFICTNNEKIDFTLTIVIEEFNVSITNSNNLYKNLNFQGYSYDYDKNTEKATLILSGIKNAFRYSEELLTYFFSDICVKHSKLFFHSASLIDQSNNAYIFYGPSGIGKSTLAGKIQSLSTFSDDIIVIENIENNIILHKTPFERDKSFKEPLNVKIRGLYRLIHSDKQGKVELDKGKAITSLLSNFWFENYSSMSYEKYIVKIQNILGGIPISELYLAKENTEKEILNLVLNEEY